MLLKTIATSTLAIALTAAAATAKFTPVPNEPPTGTIGPSTRLHDRADANANKVQFKPRPGNPMPRSIWAGSSRLLAVKTKSPDQVIIAIAAITPDVATARCNAISRKVANSAPVVQINPPTGLQQCNLASKDGVNAIVISNAQWSSYGSYFVYGAW
jgi:hypothetical protein